jgi:hypothetical protein
VAWDKPWAHVLPADPDRHVAGEEEGDPAEHLLLRDGGSIREYPPDALGLLE